MKVWKNAVHSRPFGPLETGTDTIREKKVMYGSAFGSKMSDYFASKTYGEKIREIYFREFCLKDGYNEDLLVYNPRRQLIDCAIVEDFLQVLNMPNEDYGKYLAGLYLDRSRQFATLNVMDFDSSKFVSDLEEYFGINEFL